MLARTVRAGFTTVCTLGLGLACLGGLSGCTSALAGGDASSQTSQSISADVSSSGRDATGASSAGDAEDGVVGVASSSMDFDVSSASQAADAVTYADGTYYATGRGGKFGSVPVTVVIKQGRIVSVTLGANSETDAMAERARSVVIPQIIESQGVEDIDSATGATLTSTAIVDGVSQALERAAQ